MTDLVNLLYVDDDPGEDGEEHIKRMCDLFEYAFVNCKAEFARTNKEMFNKLNSGHYDVILYDVGMDRTEGYPISHSIKDLKPGAVLFAVSGAMRSFSMRRLELPDCFDGRIDSTDLAFYYKTSLPHCLKEKGIVLELKKEDRQLRNEKP